MSEPRPLRVAEVGELTGAFAAEYDTYLLGDPETLVYASSGYQRLLHAYTGTEPRYFVARDGDGAIAGVLPAFLRRGPAGAVLNSLPFYGSNGGLVVHSGNAAVRQALLDAFHACVEREGCAAATVITSPFDPDPDLYERDPRFGLRDERIGQLTPLPEPGPDLEARLMASFDDPRPRNIRRAIKAGVTCSVERGDAAVDFLFATHRENISAIGGLSKERRFFTTVATELGDHEQRIYVARIGGEPVAALLLLYFNRTVEYFTPATVEAHRSQQPLSLLIFRAMCDAVDQGYRWWNWGGTWLTQDGVYDFKRRWGTVERRYRYFTRVLDDAILDQSRAELLAGYPHFYVVPFGQLRPAAPVLSPSEGT